MADERQPSDIDNEDDELLLTERVEDQDDDQREDVDQGNDQDQDENGEEEILTFGDDAEEQEGDTNLVKHLRTQIRERDKRLAEVERSAPADEPIVVGERPGLWDDGIDGDEDKLADALEQWADRKAKAKAKAVTSEEAQEREREAWRQELQRVDQQKAELPFDDADDAFDTVRASLNTVQQAVVVKASDNAARVIYALAKHPERLAELAAIQDPLKLAAKVARMEGQLKVIKRRRAPDPDRPERGSGRVSTQGKDKHLEKLERDAERTGDRTELIKYRKQKREKSAKK